MAWPGEPMKAPTDETMITRPRWSRSILARARLVTRNTPDRLVSMTSDQASSPMRSTRVSWVMPALATRTSTGPQVSSMVSNAALTWAGSVTSQANARRPPAPPPPSSSTTPDREVTATRSPWSANHRAVARPMPRVPPVTSTDATHVALGSRTAAHDVLPGVRIQATG